MADPNGLMKIPLYPLKSKVNFNNIYEILLEKLYSKSLDTVGSFHVILED